MLLIKITLFQDENIVFEAGLHLFVDIEVIQA